MPISLPLRLSVVAFAWAASLNAVVAQSAEPPASPAERAARRFPQPVRVGDLIGRTVLAPEEQQAVLGRLASIVRRSDGSAGAVIAVSRWFGLGARPVVVPLDAIGLLGEYVVLLDVTPDQLSAAASYAAPAAAEIPPDDTIRVGLAKPFH